MLITKHFAWFVRETGVWMMEWRGKVPEPEIDPLLTGDARLAALNAWQQAIVKNLIYYECEAEDIEDAVFNSCPSSGAVCLDVTQFNWPVGDHRYHIWNDSTRMLDWPTSRKFVQVRLEDMEAVSNITSHRPVPAPPGHVIVDITDTPLAPLHGTILGHLLGDTFLPGPVTTPAERLALAEAPLDILAHAVSALKQKVSVRD